MDGHVVGRQLVILRVEHFPVRTVAGVVGRHERRIHRERHRDVLPFGIGQRRLNRLFDRGRIVAEGGRLHLVGLRHVEVHDIVELVVIGIIVIAGRKGPRCRNAQYEIFMY